jgi:hypothetical protein
MTKILTLSNHVINTEDIHRILIKPNKYSIEIVRKDLGGLVWLFTVFGFNNIISSQYKEIEICKHINPHDYQIVYEWINKID